MKEIKELNERLLGAMNGNMPEFGYSVGREWDNAELKGVPDALREEIRELAERLGKAIPEDFGFTLCLGDEEPGLCLEYGENVGTSCLCGRDWDNERPLLEQLKAADWDAQRAWLNKGSEFFDLIAEAAKELPVMIPRTKRLQRRFREPTKAYIKEKRSDLSCAHVLLWDGEDGLYDEKFESLKAFQADLYNLMPCMVHVVAVVADGKPVPAETIDAFKSAALKELEEMPISHAKASGKFAFIMGQLEGQGFTDADSDEEAEEE